MTTINTNTLKQILKDINSGVFSYPDATTIEFYGEDDTIEVRADIDYYYDILDFQVIITDENGDETYLCEEQLNELAEALEYDLRDRIEEAEEEAKFIKYLYNHAS